LQPRKNVVFVPPFVVTTLNLGDPPWHWPVFARLNAAELNVWPLTSVIDAPAEAFVDVAQFLARCRAPAENDDVGQPVFPGSKTHGEIAAAAEPANATAAAAARVRMILFMRVSSFSERSSPLRGSANLCAAALVVVPA
jgi:hypothetical protein